MIALGKRLDALENSLYGLESERGKDIIRKRQTRSLAAEIVIPEPKDLKRRELCLADPERALRTYFKPIFYNPFARHHSAMIDAIWDRAFSGGDKAIAAPRGDGKSQIAICMTVMVILGTPISFPVLIGNTHAKGRKLFLQVKNKFSNRRKYPEFVGDFPEITACVLGLDGTPQRAAKQHVGGIKTEITWSQDLAVFPFVSGMPWGENDWGGKRLVYFGLDSAIRGEGFEEDRPDLAVIDDPETREVAFSPTNRHEDIEDMINGDVAGLSGPDKKISRVILTTIQNRRCYSWRVTDSKRNATFAGERHPLLAKWPDNKELWDEYISIRQEEQKDGKKDSPRATQFYRDRFDELNQGAELTNPHRFVSDTNSDGDPVEVDALQAFFNRVADWGIDRVMAELQQEPTEEETEQSLSLTPGKVASRISGLAQHELPKVDEVKITVGLDIGNFYSHWTKIAWFGNATGVVIDYGVMETPGMKSNVDAALLTQLLVPSLYQWRTDILSSNKPDFVLIDSGSGLHNEAVYEFVRRAGGNPFAASKGWDKGRFSVGKDADDRRVFQESYAQLMKADRLWLYHVNTEFWKNWVHERFATPTMNESNQFNDGSLSLYACPSEPKRHLAFSHHITSEERQSLFVEGKGLQTKWICKSKNNHWLDATALACAAAGVLGVRLVQRVSLAMAAVNETGGKPRAKPVTQSRFRNRPGGWVQGVRK